MPSLYLIDAHAYLHRAFHALPRLTNPKGEPIQAVYGFVRMLLKIMKQYQPDSMVVCFDSAGPTQRHQEFEQYKATRKEIDSELISQFPKARDAIRAMGLALVEEPGLEADDLIAYLALAGCQKNLGVVIVSGDKDVLQLVRPGIQVLNEPKDILYDPEKVKERYGVNPQQLPDVFALMGDSSDNVPGVPGIGEKTAVKLIQEHQNLEALLKAAPSLKGKTGTLLQEHAALARLSRQLVELNRATPITPHWPDYVVPPTLPPSFTEFLTQNGFLALVKELSFRPAAAATLPFTVPSVCERQILKTASDLEKFLEEALQKGKLVLDVETDQLDPAHAQLVGLALAHTAKEGAYLPFAWVPVEKACAVWNAAIRRGQSLRIGGHNLKYDRQILLRHGFELPRLDFDTMLAAYVLNPSRNSYGLKELAMEMLNEIMTPIDQLIGKGAQEKSMADVPVEQVAAYASADADMTMRLWDLFEPSIKEQGLETLFHELEMPLIPILNDMEQTGVLLDLPYLQRLEKDLNARLKVLELEVHHSAGEVFNLNSPKQLAPILFEKLKLPLGRRTKTGFSTDEDTLQKLAGLHPLPAKLLEHREVQKLLSTYIVGLQQAVDTVDGRVHTHFNQTGAATGRLSSSQPNLQNIPIRTELGKNIRTAFIPPPGQVLLSADYSQIDLRALAHMSQDPVLLNAFRHGEDVHTTTACQIFGLPPDAIDVNLRRIAKSINFGIVYGLSAYGLSQQLSIPMEEAKSHIDRYFERYAGVRAWMDRTIQQAYQDGFVKTLKGRIRYLPDLQAKNPSIRGFGERAALNTPIQGTSADVIKAAMIRVAAAHKEGRWKGRLLLQVHDELVFEIPAKELRTAAQILKPLMEEAIPLSVPVVVDFKSGPNWNNMTPL